jgi:hypothetical protein
MGWLEDLLGVGTTIVKTVQTVIAPPPPPPPPVYTPPPPANTYSPGGGAGYTPVIVTNKPSGGATYTPISQDNTTIPVVKGGLEGINSSVNKGMLMQTIETTNGSNQTIQNKKSWIELQRPILEQKDLEIEALVKGNVTGTTWIGSETGYWNVNQKIKEYNELNTEFKANVTQYNIMDAENPQTTTITSIFQNTPTSLTSPSPINNSFEVGIVSKIKDIFGGARNMLAYTPLGATFIGTSQEKEAAYARSAKLNSNLGITVGMVSGGSTPYGYAAEAGYSFLGLKATLASNPVGWGAAIAGTTTFILESTDRLGLLKDTKEYSVRTAGRDFSSWWEGEAFKARFFRDTPLDTFGSSSGLPIMPTNGIGGKSNIKSEPSLTSPIFTSSLMGSGTGTYQGGEVPSQSKSWSEISPFKATYSEKPAYVNPTSEIPVQKRTIVEIFDTGKPQETSNPNKVGWDVNIKNPTKNPNDFIDQYGVSYPNPNKNPTGNPTSYITGNPFKTPNENPNKNPYEYTYPNTFELPNENPTKNPYTSSYLNPNPNVVVFPNKNPYDYNFENPKPEKPPNKDWKIDLPWLPNLNWGGGPRGFGGGSRRGIFAFRENSPAWTPGQMARGIFDIGFSKKTSINTKLGVGVKTPKMNPLKSNIIFKPNKKIKNHTTHISSQMARGIFDIKFKVKKPTSLKIKGISYKKRK